MALTIIRLPEGEIRTTIKKGTVVYSDNQEVKLSEDLDVIIESRGATNYDNQRRAVHPINRTHLFWVQGQDILGDIGPDEITRIIGSSK